MTKREKVEMINEAIQRSAVAVSRGAQAEVDEDGDVL